MPAPKPVERTSVEPSPSPSKASGRSGTEAEAAFLAFVDAAGRAHTRPSHPPAAARAEVERAPSPSAPQQPPPKSNPQPAPSTARGGQLAAFAAVVIGAAVTGYWVGRSGVPLVRAPWSPRSAPTVAPMTPCLPAVDIEATPEEPEPEPSATASGSASAAKPAKTSEASAKPRASASASARPTLQDDPSTVF